MEMATSDPEPNSSDISIQAIVFSCGVCQKTVPEVYATKERNHGFHSSLGDDEGIVTKMWIAECSHITCGAHLQGGGEWEAAYDAQSRAYAAKAAPFHPKGSQPRACCPMCLEGGDDRPKDLYSIRGLADGEYDAHIPASWTQCPPVKLDGALPGHEALRFQYTHLANYAQRVTKSWKDAEQKQRSDQAALAKERKRRRQDQADLDLLKTRVTELEKAEAQLQRWERRKPAINHFLGIVAEMAEEITQLRLRLSDLGYQVSDRKYGLESDNDQSLDDVQVQRQVPRREASRRSLFMRPASSHERAASDSANAADMLDVNFSSSSRKRKRTEEAEGFVSRVNHPLQILSGSDRDRTPPPRALPDSDHGRRALNHGTLDDNPLQRPSPSRQRIEVYDHSTWKRLHVPIPPQANYARPQLQLPQIHPPQQLSLPFRFSPSRNLQTGGFQNRQPMPNVYCDPPNRDRQAPPFIGRDQSIPLSQLSLRSQHVSQDLLANAHGNHSTRAVEQQDARQWPSWSRHQDNGRVPEDGMMAHQTSERSRRPLQQVSASYLNQQEPKSSRAVYAHTTPSRAAQNRPPEASVSSPFFGREAAASRPPTYQHHPPRQTFIERPSNATFSASHSAYERPLQPSLNGLSFIERPHRASDHRPLYQSPQATPRGRGLAVPHTPRNAQTGLFQRPDLPSLPQTSHTQSRSQSNTYRGRISFPPSRRAGTDLASGQEHVIARINGVRGLGSGAAHGVGSGQHVYDGPRSLISAQGGRRSVRR